jgi:hypothetical protein
VNNSGIENKGSEILFINPKPEDYSPTAFPPSLPKGGLYW